MDSPIQLTENSQENAAPEEQTHQLAVAPVAVPPFATASFSYFTAVQHATHSFRQLRSSSLFSSPRPTQAASGRVPTQASSLAHLSLSASASTASPARISCGSTISANPLQRPLTLRPHRALDLRCARLLPSPRWPMSFSLDFSATLSLSIIPPKISFDCNVSGNADPGPFGPSHLSTSGPDPSLDPHPHRRPQPPRLHRLVPRRPPRPRQRVPQRRHDESMSVLHVYCFDPRCCRVFLPRILVSIFQSVSDLRRRLRDRGSDLVVRVGHAEKVLAEMAIAVGAEAVYVHRNVWSWPNEKFNEWVEAAMKEEGMEVKYFWGNSLFHIDDLPFKLEDMPEEYHIFKERVQGVEVRKPIAVLDQLKGLPKRGHVEPGEMPSLKDLGVTPTASMAQDVEAPPEVGGESGALQWLKKFAAQYQAQQNEGFHIDKIFVDELIREIWGFMTRGCLSLRVLFEELKDAISAASKNDDGGSSSTVFNQFMDFLLVLDYSRFNWLKRCVSPVKQGALAGTGALV
ncbi:blue-light photoreceptor PHR2-like [Eucalyptus grandis]|uniref:blue-light photoreceptor PHR2-like n=1 Tax=Eucalyptus grandis TaxID=71139 RepID=UPI00192EEB8B|nr:blue-light photoreceptor PHR2-like [Eucalyptus grandis]